MKFSNDKLYKYIAPIGALTSLTSGNSNVGVTSPPINDQGPIIDCVVRF
jgi:hypothetical protein